MAELVADGYPVLNIRQLKKTQYSENGTKTYKELPIWVLTLLTNKTIRDFDKLKHIWNCKIKIEEYQGKVGTIQCFNCQNFGHKAGWCTAQPVCMKCAKKHSTKTCTETKVVRCTNCNGPHTANDKSCPKFQAYENSIERNRVRITTNSNSQQKNSDSRNVNNMNTNYNREFPNLPTRSWGNSEQTTSAPNTSDIGQIMDFFKSFDLRKIIRETKLVIDRIKVAPDNITKITIVLEAIMKIFE